MLISLDKFMTPSQYLNHINKILNGEMFQNTITINGKTTNITDFLEKVGLNNIDEYYYGVDGTSHYFAKLEGDEGIMLVFNKANQIFQGTVKKITNKEFTVQIDLLQNEDD